MTIRHLKIFLYVIDEGGITNAAQKLYISQPSVSQAVQETEKYYGIRLFDRISKRLYLTESGRYLEGYARHIVSLFNEMEQNILSIEDKGPIRIGASLTVGSTILPELLHAFQDDFGQASVEITIKNTKDIEEALMKNAIDISVVEGAIHTPDLVCKSFMQDEVVLVCGKGHPLYDKPQIDRQELKNEEFILREEGSGTRELFESVMTANDIEWRRKWECADSGGIISAAINSFGIGVISKLLVQPPVREGSLRILQVKDTRFVRNFSIVYHKNKYLSKPLRAFIAICERYKKTV
jgi:DNA-binding transcriptional LysR family regulator